MNQIMVVGYKGEIGSFILSGLLRVMPKALNIWCVDINETQLEVTDRISISDTIFLCVPMSMTADWIEKYKHMLVGKTIIEQCSLKERIYGDKRLEGLDIRSMHILFRPSQTPDKKDRKVALFKGQFDEVMVGQIAAITESEIVWLDGAKAHDREMAIQQALVHRMILILGKMLRGCNGSTYISKKVLELDARIRSGNKDLYASIQENKYLFDEIVNFERNLDLFDINEYW